MPATKGLVFLLASLWFGAATADVTEITRLLQDGDAQAAYNMAVAESAQSAGEPAFDFAFGMAALESGHPEAAVFAMERVLIVQPGNHRARLELARAHFLLGEYQTARKNFDAVLAVNPPDNVRQRVQAFIDEIDRRVRSQRQRLTAYVGLIAGTDSNINSATTDSAVNIPALGLVALSVSSQETDDEFREIRGGVDYTFLFSKTKSLFANLSLIDRNNFSSDTFDTRTVDLIAGPAFLSGRNRFRIPIQAQVLYVNNDSYRNLYSISGDWTYNYSSRNQLSLFGQGGVLRYPDQSDRDANLALAGGSWTWRFLENTSTFTASAYYGDESAEETAGEYNGRNYSGIRAGLQWTPAPRHLGYVTVGAQSVKYDAEQPVFAVIRKDDFGQLTLGWNWQPLKNWLLSTQIDYQNNNSNIAIYEYDRTQFYVGARYIFQ